MAGEQRVQVFAIATGDFLKPENRAPMNRNLAASFAQTKEATVDTHPNEAVVIVAAKAWAAARQSVIDGTTTTPIGDLGQRIDVLAKAECDLRDAVKALG